MSSETAEPAVAPELPELAELSSGSVHNMIKAVVFWTVMGFGLLVPPILGIYGAFVG